MEYVKKKWPGSPDGLKVDSKGNVWATGPGGVWVLNSAGKPLGLIATGVPTANCGFGDDGLHAVHHRQYGTVASQSESEGTDTKTIESRRHQRLTGKDFVMISRRMFLQSTPFAPCPSWPGGHGFNRPASRLPKASSFAMNEPRNLRDAASGLKPWTTPTEQFYVRSHFAVPKLDAATYKLSVSGHVERPFELTLAQLLELSKTSKPLLLECAGNGRVFLSPAVPGLQWGHGGVGTARDGREPRRTP